MFKKTLIAITILGFSSLSAFGFGMLQGFYENQVQQDQARFYNRISTCKDNGFGQLYGGKFTYFIIEKRSNSVCHVEKIKDKSNLTCNFPMNIVNKYNAETASQYDSNKSYCKTVSYTDKQWQSKIAEIKNRVEEKAKQHHLATQPEALKFYNNNLRICKAGKLSIRDIEVIGENDGKCQIIESLGNGIKRTCNFPKKELATYTTETIKQEKNGGTSLALEAIQEGQYCQLNKSVDEILKETKILPWK
ncbi:hypothetical protein IJ541_00315 [bacterium]|nr:hypothetical protein [bacterium]